jgi:hypothetical protein
MKPTDVVGALRGRGLLRTAGRTPWNTLAAQFYTEIKRCRATGTTCVFEAVGPGLFGLTEEFRPK